jgi:glycosyltransferase involved in cell wall biosynthesis
MATAPLVSVLTTVYNRAKYLDECIESILNSRFEAFELIIVDDGSTDGSQDIAKRWASKDQRIRFFQNQSNLGDYKNRNRAAALANGKYLKYVDADDMIGPYLLNLMVESMEEFPESVAGFFEGNLWKPRVIPKSRAIHEFYSGQNNLFHRSPLMVIIRKNSFEAVGGFSGRAYLGDFELWHKLALHGPIILLPGLARYRTHPDQQSESNRMNPLIPFQYMMFSEQFISQLALEIAPWRNETLKKHRRHMSRTILYSFKRHGYKDAIRLKRASKVNWLELLRRAFR